MKKFFKGKFLSGRNFPLEGEISTTKLFLEGEFPAQFRKHKQINLENSN